MSSFIRSLGFLFLDVIEFGCLIQGSNLGSLACNVIEFTCFYLSISFNISRIGDEILEEKKRKSCKAASRSQ